MNVLFLDIDGVLNRGQFLASPLPNPPPVERFDCDLCEQLDRVLIATEAKIVISSSWRELFEHKDIEGWIRQRGAPAADVIGACAIGMDRDASILDWLAKHSWPNYACVDDAAEVYMRRVWTRTVQTKLEQGLTAERADALIQLLRG